jgi:hypothetical protein
MTLDPFDDDGQSVLKIARITISPPSSSKDKCYYLPLIIMLLLLMTGGNDYTYP